MTNLLVATINENATIVELLLDHGANTSLTAKVEVTYYCP